MEKEALNIFDKEGNHIGVAGRDEVHREGHWHETFHCWFIKRENDNCFLYFQLRSMDKKDYPNLLDITAAGHILSHETFEDGIREVREETGIAVQYEELTSLGMIPYEVIMKDFIDRERAYLFLYEFSGIMGDFSLQPEEVSGIYRVELDDFEQLIDRKITSVELNGFHLTDSGEKELKTLRAEKAAFVPHEDSYYRAVLDSIKVHIYKEAEGWKTMSSCC
ncbi:NUDIX hydrolase [Bacillus sp. SCS-153A]|uniref:NUDIX hydrolase n=1 Tax=Rossellomorea sedimentorum TaxID=3115294 RepID=UPI003905D577